MNRATMAIGSLALLFGSACSQDNRAGPAPLDCSVENAYDFLNISSFDGTDSGWFQYADPTPGAFPNPSDPLQGSNVAVAEIPPPFRCGDTRALKLVTEGHNFWGAGFGDYAHNAKTARAVGTGYDGISFWARSAVDAEKQFLFNVDDGRTIVNPPAPSEAGPLPLALETDQDLDGDGFVGPGDIARDTECRLPPPSDLGEATCYNGGVSSPASSGIRVPVPGECGNAFHTRITTSADWQLFLIPWDDLVQWPCPNRLDSGIDPGDIAKFEIKLDQGMRYEIWLDKIQFYRRLPGN